MRTALFTAILLLAMALGACSQDSGQEARKDLDWPAFVEQFADGWMEAHPMMAFSAGRKEFAGRFPDWSPQGIAAEIARLKSVASQAKSFDAANLTEAQRFERGYLLAVVDRNLFWLERAEWPFRNPTFYFDWNLDFLSPDPYLTKPYAPLDQRLKDFTQWLSNVPTATAQIKANLRTPMPRTWIDQGVASFGGMVGFLRDDAPQVFADVKNDALQKEYGVASDKAIAALKELSDWLEAQRATQTEDYAIGAELFAAMLKQTEGVDVPLDRLLVVGKADLERNLAALDEACREFAPGRDRKGCMDKMNANRPEGGAVDGARKQLDTLRAFIVEQKLAKIPSDDPIKVDQAPPYQATNFAYIMTAGPYDVGMPSTYYIAPPDPSWPKEEQLAYTPGVADLMSTSVHEVWPGHFLHVLAFEPLGKPDRPAVPQLRVHGRLGALRGRDDVGSGPDRRAFGRAGGIPRRPDQQGALPQRALHLRNRHAHAGHEGRGLRDDVPRAGLPGSGQCAPAGGTRHLRSGLPQLQSRQADDQETARRLDRNARRARSVGRVPRRLPVIRRPASPHGSQGDAG